MKNQYFLKDKKISLVAQRTILDEYGAPYNGYCYIAENIWAYTRQLSQEQKLESIQLGDNETRLFVLNFREDLKLYDIIKYKDKFFSITRIDTKDDYRTELFVYCKDTDEPEDIQRIDTP